MVSDPLRSELEQFINDVSEPYRAVERLIPEGTAAINKDYVQRAFMSADDVKRRVLVLLRDSMRQHGDHNRARDWGRLCVGIAQQLLQPTAASETDQEVAADVVARLSRWRHTETGFYTRFQPYAERIGSIVWGTLPNLYEKYSRNVLDAK